jgi:hypothetical protein
VTIALQKWAMAGHSIRWGDVCLENRGLAIAGRSVFGTWRKALLAAGLLHVVSQPSAKPKRRWDRQKVMDAICLRRREGRPVNYQGVKQEDSGLLWAGRRYFGTWAKAVAAANEGYSAGADR